MDINEFKDILSVMKTESEIKNFIEKRYCNLRNLLIEKYQATFCQGINEDQIDKRPQNIEPLILNEFYVFSDLRRLFILERKLGLENIYEKMLNPYRNEIKVRIQKINQ